MACSASASGGGIIAGGAEGGSSARATYLNSSERRAVSPLGSQALTTHRCTRVPCRSRVPHDVPPVPPVPLVPSLPRTPCNLVLSAEVSPVLSNSISPSEGSCQTRAPHRSLTPRVQIDLFGSCCERLYVPHNSFASEL